MSEEKDYAINKTEFMVLLELFNNLFHTVDVETIAKLCSTEMFTIDDDGEKTKVLSILLTRWDKYATHIGFIIDDKIKESDKSATNAFAFFIMPNDDFSGDTCVVKELSNQQTFLFKSAYIDKFVELVDKVIPEEQN